MPKNILVTGANGQLGRALFQKSLLWSNFQFDFKSKAELDLSSEASIAAVFQKPYDVVINAGAYTKVDQAETEKDQCMAINADALNHIAKYAPETCLVLHVSTDYVYDHNPGRAFMETDETKPRSVYAISKLKGETLLQASKEQHIILRTSWVYTEHGHNFVKSMLRLGKEKEELSIVADQIGSPTYAPDIAEALLNIVHQIDAQPSQAGKLYGIYNFSNGGQTNWADFARQIFNRTQLNCKVINTSTEAYNAPAPRPLWSVMSKEKIQSHFGIRLHPWEESLDKCLVRLLEQI